MKCITYSFSEKKRERERKYTKVIDVSLVKFKEGELSIREREKRQDRARGGFRRESLCLSVR